MYSFENLIKLNGFFSRLGRPSASSHHTMHHTCRMSKSVPTESIKHLFEKKNMTDLGHMFSMTGLAPLFSLTRFEYSFSHVTELNDAWFLEIFL